MSSRGQRAYANARVRARRGALLGPEALPPLRGLGGTRALHRGFVALGLDPAEPIALAETLYARLGQDYAFVTRLHPDRPGLFRALAGRFDAANLALLHRASLRGLALEEVRSLLLPVGAVTAGAVRTDDDLHSLGARLPRPWPAVLEAAERAHAEDPLAFELALERAATLALCVALEEAEDAEPLVLSLAWDRDLSLLARGVRTFGLTPPAVVAALAALPAAFLHGPLEKLARWTEEDGPLYTFLPRPLYPRGQTPETWVALDDLRARVRGRRCSLAFRQSPFGLAPSVAWLLLREAEVRGLVALAEGAGLETASDQVDRALLSSRMGSA